MPNSDTEKTESEPSQPARRTSVHILFFVFVIIAIMAASYLVWYRSQFTPIGNKSYRLELADGPKEQVQGLSARNTMPKNSGMLFIYEKAGEQCMWMKDMRFSLDMIWADANKEVVHIAKDVSPATYPQSFCAANAKYVLELNSGEATSAGLQVGQRLSL